MTPLDVGELLAIFAIVSTSRSPRAKELAARVLSVYLATPREAVE